MISNILDTTRIQHEAELAAKLYTDINDACPYPFGSAQGQVFKAAFKAAHERSIITAPARARMRSLESRHDTN